jgi:Ca2+-binding RTX toxin-like protein
MKDSSDYGEGKTFLGERAGTPNGSFTFTANPAVTLGQFVSATATNETTGDTSEFSKDLAAVLPPDPRGCTITGTSGKDILTGTGGNDVICGLGGNDELHGVAGNDTIYGDAGNDYIEGGSGNDTSYGDAGNDYIEGGSGNDILYGAKGDDIVHGRAGDDFIDGGDNKDYLVGDEGSDNLYGQGERDVLITLDGVKGNDLANGGPGFVIDLCIIDSGKKNRDTKINCEKSK